ncbi:lipoprotein [Streptomyces sp. NPDC059851]|uniref:lipoprotein n=1 Tax=Streptomyces sp. NPDC059851 TaxID=3346971 RepID=UPI003659EECC
MGHGLVRTAMRAVGAGILAVGVTACGTSTSGAARGGGDAPPRTAAATGTPTPAPSPGAGVKVGGSVGGEGTPCRLPVSFDLVQDWKPKAVTHAEDDAFAALFKQGGMTLACEIDAKPAGNLGFLRVWVADEPTGTGGARKVLESFMTGEKATGAPVYTELPAGTGGAALPVAEAAYETAPLDEAKKERAFAVVTPGGAAVVVHLGGLDTGEHDAMLPAYRLAQQSLKPGH